MIKQDGTLMMSRIVRVFLMANSGGAVDVHRNFARGRIIPHTVDVA